MKIFLKSTEIIDYIEEDHVISIRFYYSIEYKNNGIIQVEIIINEEDNLINKIGIWLCKFYKGDEITLYYKNLRLTYNQEKLLNKEMLFSYE